ncbi:MAG TPA: PHP domain-containing protein, partial [Clostridiaceae bacterium]|nr:PHP domain-containing protein [Clostridiaceae bacterium]
MNPGLQQSSLTLHNLISRYTADDRSCCPAVKRTQLDKARLFGVKLNDDGVVKLSLGPEQWPEAKDLARSETELAELLGANQVQFYFSWPDQRDHSSTVSVNQGELSRQALHFLPWLLDDWSTNHGFAVVILKNSTIKATESGLIVVLPEALRATMSNAISESMRLFFIKRVGLDISVNVVGNEFDFADAAISMEQRMLANVRRLQKAAPTDKDKGLSEFDSSIPPWEVSAQDQSDRPTYKSHPPKYKRKDEVYYGRVNRNLTPVGLSELTIETGSARFVGQVVNLESKLVSQGQKVLLKFDVFGTDGAIACRAFVKPDQAANLEPILKQQPWCGFDADVAYNNYDHDITATVRGIEPATAPEQRGDTVSAEDKRVELHCHTRMSSQDAMCSAKEVVQLAAQFGHPAVAITDHGVVQSFPEAAEAAAQIKAGGQAFKLIYGMEGYLVDDGPVCVYGIDELPDYITQFVALDLETTGLDPNHDRIIEVGAVRYIRDADNQFVPDLDDSYQTFVNPQISLTEKIQKLTGITDFDLVGAPDAFSVMQQLKSFIGADPIVGHNVLFDLN